VIVIVTAITIVSSAAATMNDVGNGDYSDCGTHLVYNQNLKNALKR